MKAFNKLKGLHGETGSLVCVGLDSDLTKIPKHLGGDLNALLKFNSEIIDATKDLVCAYKMNFAFYEQYGTEGFEILKKTFELIPDGIFTIADAKRGDIGNTSKAYAKSCFEYFGADSVTVNPYMGKDSVLPFLEFEDKMIFLLALTSNAGSNDFQRIISDGKPVYRHVIEQSKDWGTYKNIGYVVGATHPDELKSIRDELPEHCLLIPGVGAQGGSVEETIKANAGGLALINVSRAVIYASGEKDFAEKARSMALEYKNSFGFKSE